MYYHLYRGIEQLSHKQRLLFSFFQIHQFIGDRRFAVFCWALDIKSAYCVTEFILHHSSNYNIVWYRRLKTWKILQDTCYLALPHASSILFLNTNILQETANSTIYKLLIHRRVLTAFRRVSMHIWIPSCCKLSTKLTGSFAYCFGGILAQLTFKPMKHGDKPMPVYFWLIFQVIFSQIQHKS